MPSALTIRVRGIVQGVGFRPFVYRLAQAHKLAGWVLNGEEGVQIFLEGESASLEAFLADLETQAPPASRIAEVETAPAHPAGFRDFTIRESERRDRPTVRISPDLPVCEECVRELFDPTNPRHRYPYINCTNCGPRYSVILSLPYDRCNTTMKSWPLDEYCGSEYHDPANRRFHAQPVACPVCGPSFLLRPENQVDISGDDAIRKATDLLRAGSILAIKGLGGYHLACDAQNAASVEAVRARKFRKEKPFAVMVRDLATARDLVHLDPSSEALLTSPARPIVLARAKLELAGVAPDNQELGLMLPYTPLHYLLFAAGAPEVLVMTSANRSSEPIAYEDDAALEYLAQIADAFLIGQRPIARRVEDSVARVGAFGPAILRRSRGYAPGAVTQLPSKTPILAVGPDLKNTITLVVDGQAFVSQHVGDLSHYEAFRAFRETIQDLVKMYEVPWDDLLVVHDAHPQYASTMHALELPVRRRLSVQHHRAHVASVLAERGEWQKPVVGVSFDGTGYGDDGSIWGGEFFVGSVADGFERIAHLRPAALPGGDAAAQFPVQAAAGFLAQVDRLPDLHQPPFDFPDRFGGSLELVRKNVRTFPTTSVGRLFDTAAALLGFTRPISYEGQAAIWLEQRARCAANLDSYGFHISENMLDWGPAISSILQDRLHGRSQAEIARAFQRGMAHSVADMVRVIATDRAIDTVVFSGGVFQNELLLQDIQSMLQGTSLRLWTNRAVPANDGGVSLGQAALASFSKRDN